MPAKKTVTLATKCAKAGHKRIVHVDAKTAKTSYPCRKIPKAPVGPSTKCPFIGEKRKLVAVKSKSGKTSSVWRCAPKPKAARAAGQACKKAGTVLREVTVKGEKVLRCKKYAKGTPTVHTPCKNPVQHRVQVTRKAKNGSSKTVFTCRTHAIRRPCPKPGMSRVKVVRTAKNGSTKNSFVCRKSATKANRVCPKPGQVRRPVMVGGKKVMRCRSILKRGNKTNTYKPMYKMFNGPRKARKARTPLYKNANPTMTDIVNASDASLIRVLAEPLPMTPRRRTTAPKRKAAPKPRKTAPKRKAAPKPRKTAPKRKASTPATGPRRSTRIASR